MMTVQLRMVVPVIQLVFARVVLECLYRMAGPIPVTLLTSGR